MFKETELYPLSVHYGLYCKDTYKVLIKIKIPSELKCIPQKKAISNWELLEKVHMMIKPTKFLQLKIVKNSSNNDETISMEGELNLKSEVKKVISLLHHQKLKISGLTEPFSLYAGFKKFDSLINSKDKFDNVDKFDHLNTVVVKGLPTLWFCRKDEHKLDQTKREILIKPDQDIVLSVFSKFGPIKRIYLPILNPLLRDCNGAFSSVFSSSAASVSTILTFEAFIRYEQEAGFAAALEFMGAGRKLVYRDDSLDQSNWFNAAIIVEVDKARTLSSNAISKREYAILKLQKEQELKASRDKNPEKKHKQVRSADSHSKLTSPITQESHKMDKTEPPKEDSNSKSAPRIAQDIPIKKANPIQDQEEYKQHNKKSLIPHESNKSDVMTTDVVQHSKSTKTKRTKPDTKYSTKKQHQVQSIRLLSFIFEGLKRDEIELHKQKSKSQKKQKRSSSSDSNKSNEKQSKQQIMELEMRARLLKRVQSNNSQPDYSTDDSLNLEANKSNSCEIVQEVASNNSLQHANDLSLVESEMRAKLLERMLLHRKRALSYADNECLSPEDHVSISSSISMKSDEISSVEFIPRKKIRH